MSRKIPPVNAVRAFEAAARHLQFQNAAEELGVTPSALSYQIRQLESHLGIPLFRRLNRAVELTSAGELLSGRVTDAFQRLEDAFALLAPKAADNALVVSTGPAFSAKWLAPRLHSFLETAPDIDFRLSASLKLVDFIADGVDAAIRFGSGNYPGLHVEPLFEELATPLISPELFKTLGNTTDEDLFRTTSLIHDDSLQIIRQDGMWADWLQAAEFKDIDAKRGVRFSHADHALEAAVEGGGIVLGRLAFAFREIQAGRLIAPFDEVIEARGGFYFVCPREALDNDNVLRFVAWLRDEANDQAEAVKAFMATRKLVS